MPTLRTPEATAPSHPRPRWTWLVWVVLVAATSFARDTTAELTVTAYGRQTLDLATGRTVLDDGGEVVDRRSGVSLRAGWISYAEGIEVVAREVEFDGELGRVSAPEATIDLLRGRVWAGGGVVWERDGLEARGDELRFDAAAGLVGLLGGVVANVPDVAAAEAWVEVVGGRVLLWGPYRFADGPIVLRGDAGRALQLDGVATADGLTFDARTDVDPALRDAVEGLRHDGWSRSGE